MSEHHELESAIAARERGRSKVRAATVIAGVSGLAVAGIVGYGLPGSTQHHSGSSSGTAGSGQGASQNSSGSTSDDAESGLAGSGATAPGSGGSSGSSHAISGGS